MKLYSRGQLIFFSLLSAVIVALLAVGLGLLPVAHGSVSKQEKPDSSGSDSTAASEARTLDEGGHSEAVLVSTDISKYTEDEQENISVYETLNNAVVNITTETVAINWFLEPVPQEGGSGSGSIIDEAGFILTNNHVVSQASKIKVNLADGSQYEGKVIGTDPENDLAVLKIDVPKGTALTTIPYGESGNLRVGQKVLAIGNPFALERTLTVGIVSGLGRPIQTANNMIIQGMIQTDASINPGNSGGPLLDSRGRMIGVNTMIYSPSGGSVGIGFAVPVNTAKRVVKELIKSGKVTRGWIDASLVQLFPALVNYAKLPVSEGLLVSRTARGGEAEKAGIRQGSEPVRYGSSVIYLGGDIITKVDGMKVSRLADFYSALEDNKPGQSVDVELIRSGKTVKVKVSLEDRSEVTYRER